LLVLSCACPICQFGCCGCQPFPSTFLRRLPVTRSATRQSFDIASFGAAIKFLLLKRQQGHARLCSPFLWPFHCLYFVLFQFHFATAKSEIMTASLWYPQLFAWISSNEVNAFWQSSKYVAHFVCLLFAGPVNALYEIWIHLRITRDPSGPLSHQCSHRLPKDSLLGVPLMYPTTSFFLYALPYPFKGTSKGLRLCLKTACKI